MEPAKESAPVQLVGEGEPPLTIAPRVRSLGTARSLGDWL